MSSAFDDLWAQQGNQDIESVFGESIQLVDLAREVNATVSIPTASAKLGAMDVDLPDPHIMVRSELLTGLLKGHRITAQNQNWKVVDLTPRGTGWTQITIVPDSGFVNEFA